jgi:AraC-like DNA-binding protein
VTRYVAEMQAARVAERARAEIMVSLPGGAVSQATVARRLHMSVRTMQRKLRSEGLSFRDVLDSARRQLAREYAKDPSLTRTESAYLLGFAEVRSLSRAMTRWKGRSDPMS